jgi:hypothetical protein
MGNGIQTPPKHTWADLKQFLRDLFKERWIERGGGGIPGRIQEPKIKAFGKSCWSFWSKNWQPICGIFVIISVIVGFLTFFFTFYHR